MPVHFRCTGCQQPLSVTRKKIGEVLPCPACKTLVTVPDPYGDTAEAAAARRATAKAKLEAAVIDDDDDAPFKKSEAEFEELDMTPMVDVTFLLLIFFMITASFTMQKTLQVPPPEPDEKGASQSQEMEDFEEDSVIVTIEEDGKKATFLSFNGFKVGFSIDFDHPVVDQGECKTVVDIDEASMHTGKVGFRVDSPPSSDFKKILI